MQSVAPSSLFFFFVVDKSGQSGKEKGPLLLYLFSPWEKGNAGCEI